MNFNSDRMLVLSGLKEDESAQLLSETDQRHNRKKESLNESILRKIIREEIQSYLMSRKSAPTSSNGLPRGITTGFAGPAFKPQSANKAASRGPGRTIGFGGPGFM